MSSTVNKGFWDGVDIFLAEQLPENHLDFPSGEEVAEVAAALEQINPPKPGCPHEAQISETPVSPTNAGGSPALAKDLDKLRYKYLAGKVVGKDLFDKEGRIMARKNDAITRELVDSAEKQGKLAELIVNMIIPGIED